MFTGIIKKLSEIQNVEEKNGSFFVTIKKPGGWKVKVGDSISVNGVCSTVNKLSKDSFRVEYMPETIKKTTVSGLKKNDGVNLEKSVAMNDLLDGHLVQGHVDIRGRIQSIKQIRRSKIIKVNVPERFMRLIAPQGSVSVDGISLTVVDTGADWFTVSLVEYTLDNTNLGAIREGDEVNIETDMIAKYIYNILKHKK